MPYSEASQSGVLPQALASGVLVVATPVGGLPEQLGSGGGILATEVSAAALAAAMAAVLDPVVAARLRKESIAASRAAIDWEGTTQALVSDLRRMVGAG
jgi:glycosyltransferase involved in cell wall biosynthesis